MGKDSRTILEKEILDLVPTPLIALEVGLNCVGSNLAWRRFAGVEQEALLGTGWLRAINEGTKLRLEKEIQEGQRHKRRMSFECPFVTSDGVVKWVLLESDFSYQEGCFLLSATDYTSKRQNEEALSESTRRYEVIVNQATEIIFEIDEHGKFKYVNPNAQIASGYRPHELIGESFLKFVHPSYHKQVSKFYQDQIKNKKKSTYLEFRAKTKTGESKWLGQNVNIELRNGNISRILGIARDISARIRNERRLLIQDQIVMILANETEPEKALYNVLETIGMHHEWDFASYWAKHPKHDFLRCSFTWTSDRSKFLPLSKASRALSFRVGEGVVGSVARNQVPHTVSSLTQQNDFYRDEVAGSLGLSLGCWFPVVFDGNILGVLEFLGGDSAEGSGEIEMTLTGIGGQVGQFLERKKAQQAVAESETRKTAMLESALDCIISIDHEGRIVEFNPAAERTFGYSINEVRGKLMSDVIIPEQYREAHANGLKHYLETGEENVLHKRIEISALRKDGSEFPVELAISPIFLPDSAPMFTGYLRDISERIESEKELLTAKEQAEAASEAKGEFLAVMSHEIRTPLNAVIGISELAQESTTIEEQKKYFDAIRSNSETLLLLINDILDFSKIEAGEIDIEENTTNLPLLIEETKTMFLQQIEEKGLILGLDLDDSIPEFVEVDRIRLKQVLVNLISNAIKFTDKGRIDVTVRSAVNGSIEFSIADTGIGIEPSRQESVFERFQQADLSSTRSHDGTGLGLSIVNSLIGLMGGQIALESVPGQGSNFTFELPLKPSSDEQIKTIRTKEDAPDEATRSLKILVVEDRVINQQLACRFLESDGHTVKTADNGLEAVKQVASETYDLIFMDMQMPVMDGIEATRKIRSNETEGKVPIVALTANALQGSKEEALGSGMDGFLTKPFTKAQLLATARRFAGTDSMEKGTTEETVSSERITVKIDPDIADLIPPYLEDCDSNVQQLKKGLDEEDFAVIKGIGHNLKGSGMGFGFPKITELGTQIEISAIEKDPENLSSLIENLEDYLKRVDITDG